MNTDTHCKIQEAFELLGACTFLELSKAYTREDQKLMNSREWDAHNPALVTNRVKKVLEEIDPEQLESNDRMWRDEILWFWYHHATSCARNRLSAQAYASRALELQGIDHPNRITRLLWYLAHDKIDEAKTWMASAPADADEVEHQSGLELILEYEQKKFWD